MICKYARKINVCFAYPPWKISIKRIMRMNMNFEKRLLAQLREMSEKKQISAFATEHGLEQSTLSRALRGQNIGLDKVSKILDALDVKVVFPGDNAAKVSAADRKELDSKGLTILGVHVVAGAGPAWEDEEAEPKFYIAVPAQYLRKNVKTLLVNGESMEPTILDNAVVGVNIDGGEIIQGKIYAVRLPYEGIVVKRVYLDHENKLFLLRSDNLSGGFPDIKLPFDEGNAFVYGQVIWVLQSYEKIVF
jgi:SOS-response transcriptional repressor LexA